MKKIFLFIALVWSVVSIAQPYNGSGTNFISTVNSSSATLLSGAVFTGTSEDVSKYSEARVSVFSNIASATDGLSIQQSSDGTNWDQLDVFTIPASTGKAFGIPVYSKFFRIVYTNGGTNQTTFRLQTVFHVSETAGSAVRPQDARTNDNDMKEGLSYSMTYDPVLNVWNRYVTSSYWTGQSAQTATVNNILTPASGAAASDALNFNSGSVQVVSTGSGGTYIFECSNDNVTFNTMTVYNGAILTGTPTVVAITATSSSLTYVFPITHRYIRLRIATTITGGSIQAFTTVKQAAFTAPVIQVAQATAGNMNVTATGTGNFNVLNAATATTNGNKLEDAVAASGDNGNYVLSVARFGPTLTSQNAAGDYSEFATDDGGALWTRNRPLTYIRQTADGQVKATAGHLASVTIAPTGTVTAGVVTIYDSATETGTVIYSCALPITSFTPFTVSFDVAALTAIYVGYDATLANVQVTTSYR